jgi:Pyruvate/2-oxoacid:ferredoxin oxidoreductase gamma subunit
MVGALIRTTGLATLDSVKKAIRELIKGTLLQVNEKAVELGYERTKIHTYS